MKNRGGEGLSLVLVRLLVSVIIIKGSYFVSADFSLVDSSTQQVVFQTASDFVRDGCATFTENAYLYSVTDLNECNPLPPPASLAVTHKGHPWLLLMLEQDECDMNTVRRNAAWAGYSGLIMGTTRKFVKSKNYKKYGYSAKEKEYLIDAHLVNPFDIQLLRKNFSFPNNRHFMVEKPPVYKCVSRERNPSPEKNTLMQLVMDYVTGISSTGAAFFRWVYAIVRIPFSYDFLIFILEILVRVFTIPALIGLVIVLCLIWFAILSSLKDLPNFLKKIVPSFMYDFKKDQNNNGKKEKRKTRSRRRNRSPPRREPSPPPRLATPLQTYCDLIFSCRNLGINLDEPLTKENVGKAFREKAILYHPDKNQLSSKQEISEMEEKMKAIIKSRDILLKQCTSQ